LLGGKRKNFDFRRLGFPGAFCESVLSGPIESGEDIATCVNVRTEDASEDLIAVVYGSITNASGISPEAAICVSGISDAAQKLSRTVFKGVITCRDSILKGDTLGNPATCTTDDATLATKIAAAEDRVEEAINACADADTAELDFAGTWRRWTGQQRP
jgi:hypothetical protein